MLHAHLDRLDVGIDRVSAILEAMSKAQGIEISSTVEEAEGNESPLHMPDGPSTGDVDSSDT